jgi:hypothetical protein
MVMNVSALRFKLDSSQVNFVSFPIFSVDFTAEIKKVHCMNFMRFRLYCQF